MFRRTVCSLMALLYITPCFAKHAEHHDKKRVYQLPLTSATPCLVSTVYHEARGEHQASRVEVARVVLARVGDPHFAHSVCGVVLQKTYVKKKHKHYCQFSWVCHLSKHVVLDETAYIASVKAAKEALLRGPSPAKYFNSSGTCPVKIRRRYTLGRITFCVPRNQAIRHHTRKV